MRLIEAINTSLRTRLENDPAFHVMGEDILDPYGGAFKATKGLSDAFPDRTLTTPISEAGIVGFATGMALKGKGACVEIMFGDFIALAFDQLVNHAAKLGWVYNDQISVPLVVRAPMGGKRGYGATHSQSLEKHLCGVPGLQVFAVSEFTDVERLYGECFAARSPSVLIENKVIYSRSCESGVELAPYRSPDLTIVTYGGSVGLCRDVAVRLAEEDEIECNVVAVEQLSPMSHAEIARQVGKCGSVLVVEEGSHGWNFASEVSRALMGSDVRAFDNVAAPAHPIPSARGWEMSLLPNADMVHAACCRVLGDA